MPTVHDPRFICKEVGPCLKSLRLALLAWLFLSACPQAWGQLDALTANGTQPRLVSSRFSFTEGPAVDRQGNIFFTDQPNNRIWKFDTGGRLSVFMEGAGRSNGMYFDRQGNLVACADEQNQLWSISPGGQVKVLLKDFNGHRFNGPNDLWIDARGGIYFSDPYFQRDYWLRKRPDSLLGGEKLYYLRKGKKKAVVADGDLSKPNGLVGTPDGKYLYVSDMGRRTIFKYAIARNGRLKDRRVFATDMADGMTLDEQGNLYLAGDGVTIYDPGGHKIGHIAIPSHWTANVCFGGKDKKLLFITASESVYVLAMKVRGIE